MNIFRVWKEISFQVVTLTPDSCFGLIFGDFLVDVGAGTAYVTTGVSVCIGSAAALGMVPAEDFCDAHCRVIWYIITPSLQTFGGTWGLHLQGGRVSRASKKFASTAFISTLKMVAACFYQKAWHDIPQGSTLKKVSSWFRTSLGLILSCLPLCSWLEYFTFFVQY
jgi:hypothetical protein